MYDFLALCKYITFITETGVMWRLVKKYYMNNNKDGDEKNNY